MLVAPTTKLHNTLQKERHIHRKGDGGSVVGVRNLH